jgi:putative ABC transport system permease protein
MAALSWLLLRGLRSLSRRSLPPALRHGIANLYRPGNHAQAALVALSIGVMFTLTVYLVQHAVIGQMMASAPPGMPNVFLINITEKERAPLEAFLRKAPGVEGAPEMRPAVAARVVRVDGVPIEARIYDGPARRFRRARGVTWSAAAPPQTQIVSGAWWTASDPAAPEVSVSEEAARLLNARPGSKIEFNAGDRPLTARVAALYKTEAVRPGSNVEFIFTPGALRDVAVLYYGGVRVRGREVGALQRDAFKLFPSVTVINVADVLERVQEVVDQIAMVVRFISAFSILAGMIILASSVAGTRFRRIREVVILKTLGATRRRVAGIFSVEFLVLGLVAGVMGSLLATGFSSLVLKRLFEVSYRYEPLPNAAAVVLTAILANGAGWLASYRILGQKPLEALRDEG